MAHSVANKVEAAYRRGDLFGKRRTLMEAVYVVYRTVVLGSKGAPENKRNPAVGPTVWVIVELPSLSRAERAVMST